MIPRIVQLYEYQEKKKKQTIKSYLLVVVCMCVYVSAMLSIAEIERSGTWKSSEAALGPSFAVALMGSRAQLQTTHWHCCSMCFAEINTSVLRNSLTKPGEHSLLSQHGQGNEHITCYKPLASFSTCQIATGFKFP